MSISTVAAQSRTTPVPAQMSPGGAAKASRNQSPGAGGTSLKAGAGMAAPDRTAPGTGTATGYASAFRQLSADIQAMLVQAQGGTAGTATAASPAAGSSASDATGSASAVTPGQRLATDLQTLLSQVQSGQSGAAAGEGPAAGQAQGRHHHRRHEDGASADATTADATKAGTPDPTTAASRNARVAQAFAADIVKAFQAYAGTASATATATPVD